MAFCFWLYFVWGVLVCVCVGSFFECVMLVGSVGWFSWLVLFGMFSWLLCWLVVLGWFFLVGCSWFVFLGLFSRLVFLGWFLVFGFVGYVG